MLLRFPFPSHHLSTPIKSSSTNKSIFHLSSSPSLSLSHSHYQPHLNSLTQSRNSSSSSPSPSHTSTSTSTSIHPSEILHFSSLSSQWWDPHGEFGLLHSMNPIRVKFIKQKLSECENWEKAYRQVLEFKSKGGNGDQRKKVFDDEIQAADANGNGNEIEKENVRFLKGKKVLDVGCGGGLLTESLARLGATTTGLDASESNIKIANLHAQKDPFLNSILTCENSSSSSSTSFSTSNFSSTIPTSTSSSISTPSSSKEPEGNLTYINSTAEDLVSLQTSLGLKSKGTYDVVCAMEVIEHVNQPSEFLRSCSELLKPGGHLFLSTISRTLLSQILTITIAEDVLRLVEPGTHTHKQYIKPFELRDFFLEELGWYPSTSTSTSSSTSSNSNFSNSKFKSPSSTPFSSAKILHDKDLLPQELKFEIRGTGYDPFSASWKLFGASDGKNQDWKSMCNYFFWIRKPLEVEG